MTKQVTRSRLIFFLATMLLTVSAISLVGSREKKSESKQPRRTVALRAANVTTLPPVSSNVKELQVAGSTLLNQGTPTASIAIDIINNSDQPVISLEITSGDANDWSSLGIDGLEDPDNPQVAIPPHSLKTFKWHLGEVLDGFPIVIAAARFGDGTEDGEARSLEIMRKDHERNKMRKAKRGGSR